MSEDVSAGRLYLDVLADAGNLREDLRAKLDAASRDLKATVAVTLKVQGDQAKTQIDKVARDRVVKLSVTADTAPAREDIDLVSADRTVTIRTKADTGAAAAGLDVAARDRTATIKAKADTSTLGADIEKIGKTVAGVSQFTAMGAGIVEAAGAAGNLAGALVAVVAAAGQAAGLIGVLPGLLAAAGQGAGVVTLGMSGIGKAVGALTTAQQTAGSSAGASALAQMQAADQVRSAQQGLANAQIQAAESVASAQHNVRQAVLAVGDAQYNAAQSVSSSLHTVQQDVIAVSDAQYNAISSVTQAEHSLADAEYSEQQAQLALTQAREAARQNLLQTGFDLRGAVIGEAQAALSLTAAKTKLEQTLQSASSTDRQKQQAQLDLQQAQLAYDESVNKAGLAATAKGKADKAGVEGSQQVVQARHGESDAAFSVQQSEQALARARVEAARSVAAAQYQLAQAQQAAARAQVMAIRSVQDAEYAQGQAVQALADAQRTAAQSVFSAQRAYTEAMLAAAQPTAGLTSQAIALRQALMGLSPAGRQFAEYIAATVIPRYRQMQKAVAGAFLPGLQAGVKAALPLLSTLDTGLVATGTVMGGLAGRFGAFLGSAGVRSDLAGIMAANATAIGIFGDAGLHAADALRNIMVAAEPLIPRIAGLADHLAVLIDNATRAGRASGGLAGFFDKAWKSAVLLGRIAVDLGVTLAHVLGAAAPAGGTLLSSLADAADRLRAWTSDPANIQRMQAFFANTVPLAWQVGDALARIAGILIQLSADMGGGQYNVIFSALNIILSILTDITKIPGLGVVVNYIVALALAGIGLGRVAANITSIGKGLATIAKFTGLKSLLATVTGGTTAAAATVEETAAAAMQRAGDTMVVAAAAMQRAADTMVGADAAAAGAGGAAKGAAGAAATTAEGTAVGAGIGSKLLSAGIIAAIALAIVQIGVKPLLKGQSSGTQADSTKPGNWWDNPGGANPTDTRTAGQGWSTWAGAGTQIKDWTGFGQSTPSPVATPNNRGAAPGPTAQQLDPNVGEMNWTKWWQDFDRDFVHKITDWFTVSLPHLFTATIPVAGHDFVAHFDEIRHDFARWTDDLLHITANGFDGIRHAASADLAAAAQQVAVIFDGMRHETAHVWDNIYYNTVTTVIRLGKDTIAHLKSGLITPAENGLKTAWNWVYANVATPVITFFTRTLPGAWDTTIKFLSTRLARPLENGLKTAWNWVYANVATPVITFFTRTLPGAWDTAVGYLHTRFVTPFENALRGSWNWVYANVFTPLGTWFTRTLPGYLTTAVGQVKRTWAGIKDAFAGPARFVANSVINPLIGDVDAVLSFVHLPQIPKIPRFAAGTGGAPPGWAWTGEQGPELVYMQGGEIVLPSPLSRQLAGDSSFPGYAAGTPAAPASGNPGGLGGIWGAIKGAVTGALGWAKNLTLGALASTFTPVADALLRLMPKPGSAADAMIEALPRALVTDLIGYIKAKDPGSGVGAGSGADVAAYAKSYATGLGHPYVTGGALPTGWDCCLTGDTRVHGPGGVTPIRDIRAGHLVYSWEDGQQTIRAVMRQWKSRHQPVFTVQARDRAVTASANHPFLRLTPAGATEWARLDQLHPGDLLVQPRALAADGTPAGPDFTVTPLLAVTLAGEQDTWDVEIEGSHCFIADGLVVHNSGFSAWVYEKFGYFPEKQGQRHGTSETQFADPLLQSSGNQTGALAFFNDGVYPNPGHVGVVLNPSAYVSASGHAVGTIISKIANAVGYRIPKGGFKAAGTGGPLSVPAQGGSAAAAQAFARAHLAQFGWGQNQFPPLLALWNQESGWNDNAVNPSSGAYGIPQALGKGHPFNLGDFANQVLWGLNYIKGRYGSPAAAEQHELCVPLNVDILTKRGWLAYDQVQPGDETIGYDPVTGRSAWTPVTAVHVYDDAPLVRLTNKTWEATCTPHHRWLADHWKHTGRKGRNGRTKNEFTREHVMVEAQNITTRHSLRLAAEGDTGDGPAISGQEAELLGWVLGDGSVAHVKSRKGSNPDHWQTGTGSMVSVRLYQSKPAHVAVIDKLVEGLVFSRTTRQGRKPSGEPGLPLVTWEFSRGYSAELLKRSGYDHLNPVPFVLSLSPGQREAFMRGVFGAEGSLYGDGTFSGAGNAGYGHYERTKAYFQNDGPKQDAIILGIYLSGHRPGVAEIDNRGVAVGRWVSSSVGAYISETKPFIGGEKIRRADAGRGPVYCVSTGLGSWTMRQGRQVMLTGNSNNWYDAGGPLHPGVTTLVNATGRDEWVLNPQAVDLLGGAQAVARLNLAGQAHTAATAGIPRAAAAAQGSGLPGPVTVNVYPTPHQSEEEIGAMAARKLGMMLA